MSDLNEEYDWRRIVDKFKIKVRGRDAEIERLRDLLQQVNHTLLVHGHVDRDTPLHGRIYAALGEKE